MARILDDPRYGAQAGGCALSRWRGAGDRCRWCDRAAAPGWPWCGNPCEDAYRRNHWWDHARAAALLRDDYRCTRCGALAAVVEVHHIVPRHGEGYGSGCHHHLDNLATLCRAHHLEVTFGLRRSFVGT